WSPKLPYPHQPPSAPVTQSVRGLWLIIAAPRLRRPPPPGLKGGKRPPLTVRRSSFKRPVGATCNKRKKGAVVSRSMMVWPAPAPIIVSRLVIDGRPFGPSGVVLFGAVSG